MRRAILTVVLCLCATAGFATAASDQITLTGAGFSIAALEGCEGLMMLLPSSDGFAPNVGVQIQRYSGTRDEYIALSKDQFPQIRATVVREQKKGPSGWVVEYTGDMVGRSLHWYQRAELKNGEVYLATATATTEQWPSVSDGLRACVDSLKLVK
jgi:hypothetical protein